MMKARLLLARRGDETWSICFELISHPGERERGQEGFRGAEGCGSSSVRSIGR